MEVLKTFKATGYDLELVEVGLDKFEIRINGKTEAIEFDYDRACETFERLKN